MDLLKQNYSLLLLLFIILLTPNHSLKTCGGHEAFTSTTILKKCAEKIAQDGRNATS